MKTLTIEKVNIVVRKNRRARNMRLTVDHAGQVKLTLPFFIPYFIGEKFVRQKKDWIFKQLNKLSRQPRLTLSRSEEKEKKELARREIKELVRFYSELYRVSVNKVSLKNHHSRWGSCSLNRNLNFNWRIILAPEAVRRYVVVHEICHLREMNHSARFWELVALTMPDYKLLRKWLRTYGHSLY